MGDSRAARASSLDAFRKDLVDEAFRVFLVFGAICLAPATFLFWQRGRPGQALLYFGMYAGAALSDRALRQVPRARATVLTLWVTVAGGAAFLNYGFHSDARIVLLVSAVFGAVVLGARFASLLAVGSAALLALGGLRVLPVPVAPARDIDHAAAVATVIVVFLVFGVAGVLPITFVMKRFVAAFDAQTAARARSKAATRRAEDATRGLAEGKGLLDALVENSPAVIFIKDRAGRYLLVNGEFERVMGLSRERVVGRTILDLVPAEAIAEHVREVDARVLDAGAAMETQETAPSGERFASLRFPIRSPTGEITAIGAISTQLAELERQEALARESERKSRAVFEEMWHALLVLNRDGSFVEVNPGAARLFGRTREELLSLRPEELVTDESRATMQRLLSSAESSDRPLAVRGKRRDGSEFDAELRARDLPLSAGRHCLLVFRDVSAERELQRRRRAARVELESRVRSRTLELEAANRELEAFSYSVSHDLRAPLRHVSGYVGLLKEHAGASLGEEALRHLAEVASAAGRMARLIDDLLRFARIGRADLELAEVDLDALVRDVAAETVLAAPGRDVRLEIGALPRVRADRAMIRQVFANLLSNAVKFTKGRAVAHIQVGRGTDDGERAVVFVKDDGVGFDMRYSAQLFGVFQRLHPASAFEGTGVGLAHVKRIVTRLGGKVWADARIGEGATFHVALTEVRT